MKAFDQGYQARMEATSEEAECPRCPFEGERQAFLQLQWWKGWDAADDEIRLQRDEYHFPL